MEHTLKYYSLFIQNTNLTECLAILFVKSGIPSPRVSVSIARRCEGETPGQV